MGEEDALTDRQEGGHSQGTVSTNTVSSCSVLVIQLLGSSSLSLLYMCKIVLGKDIGLHDILIRIMLLSVFQHNAAVALPHILIGRAFQVSSIEI